MRARIEDVGGRKMLHIDDSVLEFVGLGGAAEVDLITDTGRRLIIQPLAASSTGGPPAPYSGSTEFDADNPKETVRLLASLEPLGLSLRYFRALHHLGGRASLETHRKYCESTSRFTSRTNATVARRLNRLLELRRAGTGMEEAVAQAVLEFPFR